MSVDEIIIKKIMRGDNLGGYNIECAVIRGHIKQLEAKLEAANLTIGHMRQNLSLTDLTSIGIDD